MKERYSRLMKLMRRLHKAIRIRDKSRTIGTRKMIEAQAEILRIVYDLREESDRLAISDPDDLRASHLLRFLDKKIPRGRAPADDVDVLLSLLRGIGDWLRRSYSCDQSKVTEAMNPDAGDIA